MKISMMLGFSRDFKKTAQRVVELERAGLDHVWVAEAYSFDAISQVGYLAAVTERIEIGTGILNVYSRTAAAMAMTAAGCDYVTGGRFHLGLGASGPQVIEGFHGMPYEQPMQRTREYIEACRVVWQREAPFEYHGRVVDVPIPADRSTGHGRALKLINHPLRADIPVWWAALKGRSVEAAAEIADGWMPLFFVPEMFERVWGDSLRAGLAKRDPALGELQIVCGGKLAIGDDLVGEARARVLDTERAHAALYVGGMGARDKNFYNDIFKAYGYEEEAVAIQDLYLDRKKDEAAALVPLDFLERSNLVGTREAVAERVAAYRAAGVTMLQVDPVGDDPVKTVETLRSIIDED